MSLKNNGVVAAVAALLGLSVSASPVCEQLVNDLTVDGFTVAEYDGSGRVVVLAEIGSALRPVADSNGDVKIYGSASAAVVMCKRNPGVQVNVFPFLKAASVGDPIKSLIAKHKAYKSEDLKAGTAGTAIAAKLSAAVSLGWDTATGTPEADEYADLLARQTSIAEWKTFTAGKVTTLTAALVTAGIDPVTYQTV